MGVEDILTFWFAPGRAGKWLQGDQAFDREVRDRLLVDYEKAVAGAYDAWRETARGCLALAILLDQVPRNVFRGSARAFAADALARQVTQHALARDFDGALNQAERLFLYLPLEHSESLEDQEACVALIAQLDENTEWADYARCHRDIIARFGRFPHRNAVLGRVSSKVEEAFLKGPKSGF